eukprot:1155599-Pelagomonas_calceolata.AAC.2
MEAEHVQIRLMGFKVCCSHIYTVCAFRPAAPPAGAKKAKSSRAGTLRSHDGLEGAGLGVLVSKAIPN